MTIPLTSVITLEFDDRQIICDDLAQDSKYFGSYPNTFPRVVHIGYNYQEVINFDLGYLAVCDEVEENISLRATLNTQMCLIFPFLRELVIEEGDLEFVFKNGSSQYSTDIPDSMRRVFLILTEIAILKLQETVLLIDNLEQELSEASIRESALLLKEITLKYRNI